MAPKQPDIELNGVPYMLFTAPDVDSYREYAEPKHVEEADIAGSSRPSKSARPDLLVWRWDSWSKGEGQFAIDPRDEESWDRYFYNDSGAVDVSTPGEIKLGLGVTQSHATGATTYSQGPYLVLTRYDATLNPNNIGFFVDNKVFMLQDGAWNDTWTDMGNAAADAGNRVAGPPRYLGGFIYAAYKDGSGAANTSRVRRIIAADPDVANIVTAPNFAVTAGTVTQANAENPIPADNRIYVLKDAGGKVDVYRQPLDSAMPGIFELVDSAKGAGSEAGIATLGKRIHIVTQYTAEEPRIRLYDGQNGYEREIMPEGFRMDTTPYDAVNFLGDILYLAGYELGDKNNEIGSVGWMAPGRTGTWRLRDFEDIANADKAGRLTVSLPGVGNRILFAAGNATTAGGTRGIFVYDASQGSISQFIDMDAIIPATARIVSIRRNLGVYYIGVHLASASGSAGEVRIYRTGGALLLDPGFTGTGYYTSSARVFSSFYDFQYREEFKVLRSVTIDTAALPANTRVKVVLEDELGNLISTDKNGDDLVLEGAGLTTKKFLLSGLDDNGVAVTRQAQALRIRLTMESLNGHTESTPTVRCVTVEADISGYAFFYDVVLAVQNMESYLRLLDRQVSGEMQANNIRGITRREGGVKQVVAFYPHCMTGGQSFPEAGVNPARWPVAVEVMDFDLRGLDKGQGFVKLRLREL